MLQQAGPFRYRIPTSYKSGMRIEGLIFADETLLAQMERDQTIEQIANVATLPGLVGSSLAMPDAHQGYGFCIGGIAAADLRHGIVSAGGVGFDINCGVRLLATPFAASELTPHLAIILNKLFEEIPCGTGRKGQLNVAGAALDDVLLRGASWAVDAGYGLSGDPARIEDCGTIPNADPSLVSDRAKDRGRQQIGTLGSGNHFLELQVVDEVYDAGTAGAFGLQPQQAVVLIHSGSRGLGHQVCTDYLDTMQHAMKRYGLQVVDRQLACVPVDSNEGREYLGAMAAAANFAFANRQVMSHWVRQVFRRVMGNDDIRIVYDVCHNIAKVEEHMSGGKRMRLLIHRKGATRAFPKEHPALPEELRAVGQPVLIPGSMGTYSYVLAGTEGAMELTFGSCCHGAGRAMSRTQAKRETRAEELLASMKAKNILVRGETRAGLVEEKPDAYKDVSRVVEVVHQAGIARKVARLRPLAVMKG